LTIAVSKIVVVAVQMIKEKQMQVKI